MPIEYRWSNDRSMKKGDLIFIIDDDPVYISFLKFNLFELGYTNVKTFETGQEYLNNLYQLPKVVLMDYMLEDTTGKKLLSDTLTFDPDILVVIISSQNSIDSAVETLKIGALDYIIKDDSVGEQLKTVFLKIDELYTEYSSVSKKKAILAIAGIAIVLVSGSFYFYNLLFSGA